MVKRLLQRGALGISLVFLLTFSIYFEQRQLRAITFQGVQVWQLRAAGLQSEILRFDNDPFEVSPESRLQSRLRAPAAVRRRPEPSERLLIPAEANLKPVSKSIPLAESPAMGREAFFDGRENLDNAPIAFAPTAEGTFEFSLNLEGIQESIGSESETGNLSE